MLLSGYFRVTLGSLWGHFRVIFELFSGLRSGHFGVTFGLLWGRLEKLFFSYFFVTLIIFANQHISLAIEFIIIFLNLRFGRFGPPTGPGGGQRRNPRPILINVGGFLAQSVPWGHLSWRFSVSETGTHTKNSFAKSDPIPKRDALKT